MTKGSRFSGEETEVEGELTDEELEFLLDDAGVIGNRRFARVGSEGGESKFLGCFPTETGLVVDDLLASVLVIFSVEPQCLIFIRPRVFN